MALDADFPPPLLQQSKTPNNIRSVIRQVNFKRVPVVVPAAGGAQGNHKVQKVVKQKVQNQSNAKERERRHSLDFVSD